MPADGGHDNARPLLSGFFGQDAAHDASVPVVEMTYRFVQKDEVKRLAQGADKGYPLLLAERHAPYFLIPQPVNVQFLKPPPDLFPVSVARQCILQLDILPCRQFTKQAQLLKQHAQRAFPYAHPPGNRITADVLPVKTDYSLIILPVSINETAQGRLPRARGRLNQTGLSALESHLPVPNV